jgi:hypothetical protein
MNGGSVAWRTSNTSARCRRYRRECVLVVGATGEIRELLKLYGRDR